MSKLSLQGGPYVVGTLSSWDGKVSPVGDIVEVRLDKTGQPSNWVARCRAIEDAGTPVLLTIRWQREGGAWLSDDEVRLKLYEQALPFVSAVDVELASIHCGTITKQAAKLGKICVVSHHDFEQTPSLDELKSIVERARYNGAVPKVAAMIHNEADVKILEALLAAPRQGPLCVIGMGEAWKQTRVSFPKQGSFLTYGYLDQPTAPGQWPAAELVRQLRGA